MFYELLVGAGGELFDDDLQPAFDSAAGRWAVEQIVELHQQRRVTPRDSPLALRRDLGVVPRRPRGDGVRLAGQLSPLSRSGDLPRRRSRRAWRCCRPGRPASGPHTPAATRSPMPRTARNRGGARGADRHLTSFDSQLGEARQGAIPCRASALAAVRAEAAGDAASAQRWALLAETEQTMIIPPRFAAYPQCEDAMWRNVQHAMTGRAAAGSRPCDARPLKLRASSPTRRRRRQGAGVIFDGKTALVTGAAKGSGRPTRCTWRAKVPASR